MVLLIKLFFTLLAETIMLFASFSEVVFEIDELSLKLFFVSVLKKSSENIHPKTNKIIIIANIIGERDFIVISKFKIDLTHI